ncbi:MAG: hypothetical protein HY347_07865 [candidate division NC10 bacterium]|nr:hypothetical protein [candidate division NC10 bacterium]
MTIADVCRLSNEVRSGELLISVFLDQALVNPHSKEADRAFVLRATYPTAPLRSLSEYVTQKLSGKHPKGSAVVRGTYGSGKSHALLALYHVIGAGKDAQATLDITDEEIASDLRKLDPELVQNATEDLQHRCADIAEAPSVIGTVLLHSFSPYGTPGAMEEEVLVGSLRSDGNINDLRAALEEVRTRLPDKALEQVTIAQARTVADAFRVTVEALTRLLKQAVSRPVFITSDHGYLYATSPHHYWEMPKGIEDVARKVFPRESRAQPLSQEGGHNLWHQEASGVEQRHFVATNTHVGMRGRYWWAGAGPNDRCTGHGGLSLVECLVPLLTARADHRRSPREL